MKDSKEFDKKLFYEFLLKSIINEVSINYFYSVIDESLILDIKSFIKRLLKEKFELDLETDNILVDFDGNSLIIDLNIDNIPKTTIKRIVSANIENMI
jgi:hypothetical protein